MGSVEDAFVYRLPDPQRTVCRDPASAEVITPTPSAAGKSYQLILDEVFGIEEQFDVETEALLEKFYQLKRLIYPIHKMIASSLHWRQN